MAGRDTGRVCTYVFDPDEWYEEHGTSSRLSDLDLDDGCWHCPHPAPDGHEYCLFHQPPGETDPDRVTERFLERIAAPGKRPKQFLGAEFRELELEHAILESADNHPIDLRHARFHGKLDWQYSIVRQPIAFDGAIFEDAARFDETTFLGDAFFSGARFASDSKAYFLEVTFTRAAIFYDVTFPGDTSFFSAEFAGRVDFIQSQFERANFREVQFDARARFKEAAFEHAEFHATTFDEGAEFESARFPERVGFRHATFDDSVRFRNPRTTAPQCRIDLRDSTVPEATLAHSGDGSVVYDLRGATVGDLEPGDGTRENWLGHLDILSTTFDGFDFAAYHDQFVAADWRLHETAPELDERPTTYGQLENTYLKAKNGANEIGDAKAAAEFFRKEMLFRRYQYVTKLREADSLRERVVTAGQWSANALLDVTSGYGERPSRVVAFSVVVVLVFAGLFAIVWPTGPYGGGVVGYLLLSLESFVTLVLGGGVTVEEPRVRLLAQIEGFIGAFLIALFVFTLTRSIHR